MQTENEKQWLQERALYHHSCYLCHEQDKKKCRYYCRIHKPNKSELKDAAEFEGRVAAKLAGILDRTLRSRDYTLYADCTRVCPAATDCTKNNLLGFDCAPYLLKWARLAVEEEIDGK